MSDTQDSTPLTDAILAACCAEGSDYDKAMGLIDSHKKLERTCNQLREQLASLGCTRSHPHENMSPICELKTELARANNQLAIAQGAREAAEWQPIKTAPKDGTLILATLPGNDFPHVIGWRDASKGIREYFDADGWCIAWDGYSIADHDSPTSWMPLPTINSHNQRK